MVKVLKTQGQWQEMEQRREKKSNKSLKDIQYLKVKGWRQEDSP